MTKKQIVQWSLVLIGLLLLLVSISSRCALAATGYLWPDGVCRPYQPGGAHYPLCVIGTPTPTVTPGPTPTPSPVPSPTPTPTSPPSPTPTPTPVVTPTPVAWEYATATLTLVSDPSVISYTQSGWLTRNGKVQVIRVCDPTRSTCINHVLVRKDP